jgi:2'-5' RNA ligase
VAAIVESAASRTAEITLRPLGVAHSEEFTKTLFIQFADNEALSHLHNELKRQSSQPSEYELKPHLSLAYAHLSAGFREYFAGEIGGPRSTGFVPAVIHFGRLKAVAIRDPVRSAEDVEAWRTLAEARLGTGKEKNE